MEVCVGGVSEAIVFGSLVFWSKVRVEDLDLGLSEYRCFLKLGDWVGLFREFEKLGFDRRRGRGYREG